MDNLEDLIIEDLYEIQKNLTGEWIFARKSGINTVINRVDNKLKDKTAAQQHRILDQLIKDCRIIYGKGFKGFDECIPVLIKYETQLEK